MVWRGAVRLALVLVGVLLLGLGSLRWSHCDGRWCMEALVFSMSVVVQVLEAAQRNFTNVCGPLAAR